MNTLNLINPLLKSKEETITKILNQESKSKETINMLLLSIGLFGIFGFLIGASQGISQAFSSAIKLPLLFYFTSIICIPTLYFYMSFLGAKQHFGQLLSFIILCNTYISLVLSAFAPVSFFFLITGYGYPLFKFINILIFGAAGFTGIYVFYKEIRKIIQALDDDGTKNQTFKGMIFLRCWAIMFAFIGLQLSFTLSPFFGLRGAPFMLITSENSNFFSNFLQTIAELFIKS